MKLTDFPHHVGEPVYEAAIDSMVDRLCMESSVLSVYQIGGVSSPGISDIDLYVIFKDGSSCSLDPLRDLSDTEKYLYVHNIFGISQADFYRSRKYKFFHNYTHLRGERLDVTDDSLPASGLEVINVQAGLEYLAKMYITMSVQKTYGIVSARNLLLNAKALLYDFEYLGISEGSAMDHVNELIEWRARWFSNPPSNRQIKDWFLGFYAALSEILESALASRKLYFDPGADLRIAANMKIEQSANFGFEHSGKTLPAIFGGLGTRYFNIQHRFNRFSFRLPYSDSGIPDGVNDRYQLIADLTATNSRQYPCFIPVPYGLAIFNRLKVADK